MQIPYPRTCLASSMPRWIGSGGADRISYHLAEFLALVTARRLSQNQAITFLQRILAHPLVEVVWVNQELHERELGLQNAANNLGQVFEPLLGGALFAWKAGAPYLGNHLALLVVGMTTGERGRKRRGTLSLAV